MTRVLFNPEPDVRQCIHSEADRSRCQSDTVPGSNYCEAHGRPASPPPPMKPMWREILEAVTR